MKRVTTLLLIIFVSLTVVAQDNYPSSGKWLLDVSLGYNKTLNYSMPGYITDNLVNYDFEKSLYYQFSVAFYPSKFGIVLSFTGFNNLNSNSIDSCFNEAVYNTYSSDYFIESLFTLSEDQNGLFRTCIGPSYKIDKDRLVFVGKSMFGISTLNTSDATSILKRKGTNESYRIDWTTSESTVFFTFNPSVTLGYRISKRIILNFDLNYWLYKIDFSYMETNENLYTHETIENKYHYNSWLNELSFGLGLSFILK